MRRCTPQDSNCVFLEIRRLVKMLIPMGSGEVRTKASEKFTYLRRSATDSALAGMSTLMLTFDEIIEFCYRWSLLFVRIVKIDHNVSKDGSPVDAYADWWERKCLAFKVLTLDDPLSPSVGEGGSRIFATGLQFSQVCTALRTVRRLC